MCDIVIFDCQRIQLPVVVLQNKYVRITASTSEIVSVRPSTFVGHASTGTVPRYEKRSVLQIPIRPLSMSMYNVSYEVKNAYP
jgi:hypothetical protein